MVIKAESYKVKAVILKKGGMGFWRYLNIKPKVYFPNQPDSYARGENFWKKMFSRKWMMLELDFITLRL